MQVWEKSIIIEALPETPRVISSETSKFSLETPNFTSETPYYHWGPILTLDTPSFSSKITRFSLYYDIKMNNLETIEMALFHALVFIKSFPCHSFSWNPFCKIYYFLMKFIWPEAEFKEFEPRLKFKPRFKFCWFHLKRLSIKTGFWGIWDAA